MVARWMVEEMLDYMQYVDWALLDGGILFAEVKRRNDDPSTSGFELVIDGKSSGFCPGTLSDVTGGLRDAGYEIVLSSRVQVGGVTVGRKCAITKKVWQLSDLPVVDSVTRRLYDALAAKRDAEQGALPGWTVA